MRSPPTSTSSRQPSARDGQCLSRVAHRTAAARSSCGPGGEAGRPGWPSRLLGRAVGLFGYRDDPELRTGRRMEGNPAQARVPAGLASRTGPRAGGPPRAAAEGEGPRSVAPVDAAPGPNDVTARHGYPASQRKISAATWTAAWLRDRQFDPAVPAWGSSTTCSTTGIRSARSSRWCDSTVQGLFSGSRWPLGDGQIAALSARRAVRVCAPGPSRQVRCPSAADWTCARARLRQFAPLPELSRRSTGARAPSDGLVEVRRRTGSGRLRPGC